MVCGEMREAAVPAVLVLPQLQQGLVPWDTHLHIPSQTLAPMQAIAQNPWLCGAARERQLLPQSECLVSASHSMNSTHTPSMGSLPK